MKRIIALLLITLFLLCGCDEIPNDEQSIQGLSDAVESSVGSLDESTVSEQTGIGENNTSDESEEENVIDGVGEGFVFDISAVPDYTGSPYCVINDNMPTFSASELTTESYEYYSELDNLGRCGYACASVGIDIMPTEDRGNIGSVKPTGWQTVKYDFVDGKYLYNRCHLLGFQLTGENANVKNLITGTRYMNVQGMLPFENMIADYVKETENHVAFRVTPIFTGNDLLARGVLMEAYSIEDDGDGICFNVFCYNVHPNIAINYANGDSREIESNIPAEEESENDTYIDETTDETDINTVIYVLNTNTKKFHYITCRHVKSIKPENYEETDMTRDEIIALDYTPCGTCHP